MRKFIYWFLPLILITTSCAHKYQGREPDFTVKKTEERIKEYKQFKIDRHTVPSPHYEYLNFHGKPVNAQDLEHVMAATRPGTLKEWEQHHWGAYMAWVATIPFVIFLTNTISDFNFTNLFLFGASATAFGYGSYLEQQYKNQIIDSYNRELKIKLNLIKADF